MEPKIGIVVCGFTQDRQFVTNPYIQSVRYAKGIPLVLPLVRSDHLLDKYTGLCDGFLFCGGDDITPLLFGEEPQKGNGRSDVTVDPTHETYPQIPQACLCHMQGNADLKCRLRRHDLAGHVPDPRKDA